MKNKICKIIYLLFFSLLTINVNGQEQFNFDVTEIIILENGNKFIGTKRGTITSNNDIVIKADQFEYEKKLNILKASGNVKLFDKKNNYEIYSNNVTYNKKKNLILTEKNSKAFDLKNNIEINAENFKYRVTENIIIAENRVNIENKIANYKISSNQITYLKNENKIYSTGKTIASVYSKYKFETKNVIYLTDLKQLSSEKKNNSYR